MSHAAEVRIAAREATTGHNVVGGLQRHSTGETYPWTVIAEGDLCPPLYRAYNCITGRKGPVRESCRQAHDDAGQQVQHEATLAAVRREGFHVWPHVEPVAGARERVVGRAQ